MTDVCVVLPCLNEKHSVISVVSAWLALDGVSRVCFVDNGSTDGSVEKAMSFSDNPRFTFLSEEKKGKGNAVSKALKEVPARVYVLCDVDMTYEVSMRVAEPVLDGVCDMCIGLRTEYFNRPHGFINGLGNRVARVLCRVGAGIDAADPLSGLRAFSAEFAKDLRLPEGFGMEAAMARHAGRCRFRVGSVPVWYAPRAANGDASKISIRDSCEIIRSFFI